MESNVQNQLTDEYNRNGFISGIPVIDSQTAKVHRNALEEAEKTQGNLHYLAKIHTIFQSPGELAMLPVALDIVEQKLASGSHLLGIKPR